MINRNPLKATAEKSHFLINTMEKFKVTLEERSSLKVNM